MELNTVTEVQSVRRNQTQLPPTCKETLLKSHHVELDENVIRDKKNTYLSNVNQSKIVKLICVIAVIIISITSLMLSIHSQYKPFYPVDYTNYNSMNNSNSSCHTQYNVLNRVKVNVCWVYKGVVVDIREFIGETPTIKGIQLSHLEWEDFMTYVGLIDYIVRNGPSI